MVGRELLSNLLIHPSNYLPGTDDGTRQKRELLGVSDVIVSWICRGYSHITYKKSTSAFGHIFDEELRVSSSRKKGAMASHCCNTFLKDFKPGKELDDLLYESSQSNWLAHLQPIYQSMQRNIASPMVTSLCICTIYCAYFRFYIYHAQPLQTKCITSSSHYHIAWVD